MILLHTLPHDHSLRAQPLEGAYVRGQILIPLEVTDTDAERADKLARRARGERTPTPWKRVTSWRHLSRKCYNDLGAVWTEHHEWTFDKPTKKKVTSSVPPVHRSSSVRQR
jgi:hypothetical protein